MKTENDLLDFDNLEVLLDEFKYVPAIKSSNPTIMELSGYPHFENGSSNILSFFFDTNQVHGFKDLLLQSLIDCIPDFANRDDSFEVLSINREYVTDNNNRIDLVIECDTFVIAIENKIFHWLNNDLSNYKAQIEKDYSHYTQRYFVVLSTRNETVHSGFVSVTYRQFFSRIKAHFGDFVLNSESRYCNYLNDFIQTIENLTGMNDINIEMGTFDFFQKNAKVIDMLLVEKVKIENLLIQKRRQIAEWVDTTSLKDFHNKWIWKKEVIAFDFLINGKLVALDVIIQLNKIEMELFEREGGNYELINRLSLIKGSIGFRKSNKGYIIFEKTIPFYKIDSIDFAGQILKFLELIKIEHDEVARLV